MVYDIWLDLCALYKKWVVEIQVQFTLTDSMYTFKDWKPLNRYFG